METKLTLFEIEKSLLDLYNAIEESGGEITPEQEQALILTSHELEKKSGNYVAFIKKLESEAEMMKVYKAKAEAEIKRREKLIEKLKDALLFAVKNFGEIQTDRMFKLSLRRSESVEITDIDKIPNEYKIFEPKASKADIKVAIKAGIEVPGAMLIENQNLSIK